MVLLKVMPEYDEGIFSKSVDFLQAINEHRNRHKKGLMRFMKFLISGYKKGGDKHPHLKLQFINY